MLWLVGVLIHLFSPLVSSDWVSDFLIKFVIFQNAHEQENINLRFQFVWSLRFICCTDYSCPSPIAYPCQIIQVEYALHNGKHSMQNRFNV